MSIFFVANMQNFASDVYCILSRRGIHSFFHVIREVMMGVGNGVASVIMLTFTKMPGPHADFYKDARPPC